MTWYLVDVGYACAGIATRGGVVVTAAPIYGWAIGKSWTTVRAWVEKKRGRITAL